VPAEGSAGADISAACSGSCFYIIENEGNGFGALCAVSSIKMLKITVHDAPEALTFQVEGKLIGAWARELEQSWRRALSLRRCKAPIVDLTETMYIDEEGKRVLATLFREGAFFLTAGPMTKSIVAEVVAPGAGTVRSGEN